MDLLSKKKNGGKNLHLFFIHLAWLILSNTTNLCTNDVIDDNVRKLNWTNLIFKYKGTFRIVQIVSLK